MPFKFMADVIVQERPVAYGPRKGEMRWFVCKNGVPMDAMYDFFDAGKLRKPYPFRRMGGGEPHDPGGQHEGYATREEAMTKLMELEEHVAEVVAMPMNKKPGSAKSWR